jgi:hypothetical protein
MGCAEWADVAAAGFASPHPCCELKGPAVLSANARMVLTAQLTLAGLGFVVVAVLEP